MYSVQNEILKELNTYIDCVDETNMPTIDELLQIQNKIGEGLELCKQLYIKTGSIKEAIIMYEILYLKKKIL